jgi:subtilase family serine protease
MALLVNPRVVFAQTVERQVLYGHVPAVARNLTPVGAVDPSQQLRLAIGLPLRQREALTNLLQRLYDPAGPEYRHFLTPAQFAERFGPAKEDYAAVMEFAKTQGLNVVRTNVTRTLLDVTGSARDIQAAFHVTLRTYQHPRENRAFFAPDTEPSVDLAVPLLHVSGLDNYLLPRPLLVRPGPGGYTDGTPTAGSAPDGNYWGNDFRAAYVPGVSLTGAGQSVGLLEFESGFYTNDIAAYAEQAGIAAVPVKTVLLDGYDGGPGDGNVEVSLDIEMAMSMAPGLVSVIVYEGEITDDILDEMATESLANQLSASWTYGIDATSEQIFQQFGAQGQSFFNASGDSDALYHDCGRHDAEHDRPGGRVAS